ncbi:hypothetical protein [Streptomyces sp. NBC_00878]|uniref:hypothetical protein n=1 Tax=Streptomyces sp. NBC_00878 TaxID=2975854 RepID=UPI00225A043F|nr:hypothetical protein [Streptomyces sp. NBC_00878]MCX4911772.1 hypothetical protein [Streptomyces sp. NBC_00878]
MTTTEDFRPTHVVPRDGLPAWEAPDPTRPTVPLDALLPVRLVERRGDWGHVLCANGWSAWVDGRLLLAVPQMPPAAGQPLARTADPRPLLARVEDTLGRYRQSVEELASGRLDGEEFQRRTRGMRVGIVVDGEAVWLYEAEHERWVYCDGTRLSTYATPEPPVVDGPEPHDEAGPEPTQVVPGIGPEPTQVVGDTGPEPTQVVGDTGPEPTQAVGDTGPEPTQAVGDKDSKSPRPEEDSAQAPTRLVTGDGDG